ncbi:MAG: hypothetical protein V3R87_02070 [Dehalococcoidia bacterium]
MTAIKLKDLPQADKEYFLLLDLSWADLNALCDVCGKPFGEHTVGGNAPWHPESTQ